MKIYAIGTLFLLCLTSHATCGQVLTSEVKVEARANTIIQVDGNTIMEVNSDEVHVNGTITSDNVWEIVTIEKTMQLTTAWQDTGINAGDLPTGTYIIQLYLDDHDADSYGGHWHEYYSGVMSWFAPNTNNNLYDEIQLHRAGHSPRNGLIKLRTKRNPRDHQVGLMLQINANYNAHSSSNYVFKFKRII